MMHASIVDRGGGYAETSIGSQTGDRKLMRSALSKLAAHPPRLQPFSPAVHWRAACRPSFHVRGRPDYIAVVDASAAVDGGILGKA